MAGEGCGLTPTQRPCLLGETPMPLFCLPDDEDCADRPQLPIGSDWPILRGGDNLSSRRQSEV